MRLVLIIPWREMVKKFSKSITIFLLCIQSETALEFWRTRASALRRPVLVIPRIVTNHAKR